MSLAVLQLSTRYDAVENEIRTPETQHPVIDVLQYTI